MTRPLAILVGAGLLYLVFRLVNPGPALAIRTRPDAGNPGQLGIGLTLRGVNPLARGSLMAQIEIKTTAGTVVHQDTEKLEKFTFG